MLKRAVAVVVVIAVILAVLLYSQKRREPLKVSGYVESDEIRLGSRVGGRVAKVHAVEGQAVKAGEVLAELEPFDLIYLRAQTEAQLAQRKAEYEKLTAGFRAEDIAQAKAKRDELDARLQELVNGPRKETIDAAHGRLAQSEADARYAQSNFDKIKLSLARGAATTEELDKATQLLDSANAAVSVRRAELAELEAGSRLEAIATAKAQLEQAEEAWKLSKAGYQKEDIAAAKEAVEAAKAAVQVIDSQIAELQIKAPVDGVIEASDLQPGQLVSPSAPALTMLDAGNLYIRSYIPENRLAFQVGRKVRITTDSFPDKRFDGKIVFLARQGEFTPSNVQTTEKRVEQVFRVKVKLDSGMDVLRPGMPVDVWLEEVAGK
jgi:multidrug resistance efflux pump